ncbi:MAG: LytTR family DNA-binding domain-containing protein [Oricola sp.]
MKIVWKRKIVTVTALVAIAAIAGPFGTYVDLAPLPRFLYWLAAVIGCGLFMNAAIYVALTHPQLDRIQVVWRLAAAVIVAAMPATLLVMLLEYFIRTKTLTPGLAFTIWSAIAIVGFFVGLSDYRQFLGQPKPLEPAIPGLSPGPSGETAEHVFFRQLKPGMGHKLVSLTIHDHYLEVVTETGGDMILKRLGDAVAELANYHGLQVHRSHWVALDAIAALETDKGKCCAVLRDGRSIPVSRLKAPELKRLLAARSAKPVTTEAPAIS